jgi:fucose 4-O-acetylase-like acetyltransferase
MLQNRLPYLDVAKGIAIWLMIVGHQYVSDQAHLYIYSFHMPLFFFISGMFFRNNNSFFQNLESAVRGLLIPYLFFSLLNLAICWISPYLHPELYYNMKGVDIIRAAFNGIFIGTDMVTSTSFLPLGPLWFLVALFVIKVFCSGIASLIKKNEYVWATVSVVVSIILYFIITVPVYSLRSAMMAVPFYVAGFMLRRIDFQNLRFKIWILLALVVCFVYMVPLNGKCESDGAFYGNWMILYYFNAMMGILIVIILSSYLSNIWGGHLMEKIGRNTLAILGIHRFFAIPIQVVCVSLLGYDVMKSTLYIIIVPIVVIIASLYAANPISRYVPFAVGKRRLPQVQ